jgi:hypothetical protein
VKIDRTIILYLIIVVLLGVLVGVAIGFGVAVPKRKNTEGNSWLG